MSPFEVVVQTKERTFIDKIFAVCDYYLSDKVEEHSRHLYDLYKLLPVVDIGDELDTLVDAVRNVRKDNKMCLSAQDECDVREVLQEIIDKDIYKSDYQNITQKLLFEPVEYDTVIEVLQKIVNLDIGL